MSRDAAVSITALGSARREGLRVPWLATKCGVRRPVPTSGRCVDRLAAAAHLHCAADAVRLVLSFTPHNTNTPLRNDHHTYPIFILRRHSGLYTFNCIEFYRTNLDSQFLSDFVGLKRNALYRSGNLRFRGMTYTIYEYV